MSPIFIISETNFFGKEKYYSQFVTHLKNLNVNIEEFTFYIVNTLSFLRNGENLFLIRELVPYLRENKIPYEMTNFNPINGEAMPSSIHLYLNMDTGGRKELLNISEGEIVSFVGIKNETYGEVYIYNPDIVYDSGRTRIAPVFIACRDKDKLEKLIRHVHSFSLKRMLNCSDYILHNGKNLRKRPSVTWDELILPEGIKNDIRSNIEAFFSEKEFFLRKGLSYKRGFLLIGPPGNGKTMLCRVIAGSYREIPLIYYQNEGEFSGLQELKEVFQIASAISPSILCLEDIDVILKQNYVSTVPNLIDGLSENEGILLLATTNHPENLDQNILNRPNRFDRIWKFSNPDKNIRLVVLRRLFGSIFDERNLLEFAIKTEGFSMAYMKEILISSYINAKNDGRGEPSLEDVRNSIEMLKKQLSKGERLYNEESKLGFLVGDENTVRM